MTPGSKREALRSTRQHSHRDGGIEQHSRRGSEVGSGASFGVGERVFCGDGGRDRRRGEGERFGEAGRDDGGDGGGDSGGDRGAGDLKTPRGASRQTGRWSGSFCRQRLSRRAASMAARESAGARGTGATEMSSRLYRSKSQRRTCARVVDIRGLSWCGAMSVADDASPQLSGMRSSASDARYAHVAPSHAPPTRRDSVHSVAVRGPRTAV